VLVQAPSGSLPDPHGDGSLDEVVRQAFEAWDQCYCGLSMLRHEYDAAMQLHERREGPDPAPLRARLKGLQADCDQLFFKLLKAAESRMRERYI
jgi:hypothetical protein